ncbi:MAG: LytR C-terminal domain-containing protein [Promicromonosporaceae bacterium]|nr:LytR C-terminal domain-containing protein [Promicromonosporaceae bacterium]
MAKDAPQDVLRIQRRRREHQRQAVIYGVLCAALVFLALGAFAIYTGAIESPFQREFTQPQADALTTPPCLPTVGDVELGEAVIFPGPTPYADIHLRVFNASGIAGLAAANQEVLERRGFEVAEIGDFGGRLSRSELRFGVRGITDAYTVAAQFPTMRLVLDDRITATVDLLVGQLWEEPLAEEAVALAPDMPLLDVEGCQPADRITPAAAPGR